MIWRWICRIFGHKARWVEIRGILPYTGHWDECIILNYCWRCRATAVRTRTVKHGWEDRGYAIDNLCKKGEVNPKWEL